MSTYRVTEQNQIEDFFNHELGLPIHGFTKEDGTVYVNLQDVCIGLGFTTTNPKVATSGNCTYERNNTTFIRWNRVFKYLDEIKYQFDPIEFKKDDAYIPESVFYLLAMKAKNKAAIAFQRWIAFEVIPDIRKTGIFANAKYDPVRALSVFVRKLEAGSINRLVMYYKIKKYPIKKSALYTELSTMVNSIAKIHNGERNEADMHQLSVIVFAELNIRDIIEFGIADNMKPDDIKCAIWDWLLKFSHYSDENTPETSIRETKKKRFHIVKNDDT